MLVLPLADPVSISQSALDAVMGGGTPMMGGCVTLGTSIASIFLLFVIFRCITSILEGGKFSVQMLGPVVIYLCVCNFSFIARPVSVFVTSIQSGMYGHFKSANDALYTDADGNRMSKLDKFIESYNQNNAAEIAKLEQELEEASKKPTEIEITDDEGDPDSGKPHKKFLGIDFTAIGNSISRTLKKWWEDIKLKFTESFLEYQIAERKGMKTAIVSIGFTWILAVVLDFFVKIITAVMTAMGGVLVGVAMAFGPISWAFAVIPGNGGAIKAWFIRICQFGLYSPLCALVNYFSSKCLLASIGSNAGSVAGLIAVLICNLVLLTAIPQIASSIIEGASGGLSLSNGVQTLISPVRMLSEFNMVGERKRDSEQLQTLKEISRKLGK